MKLTRRSIILAAVLALLCASSQAAVKPGDKVPDDLGHRDDGSAIHASQYQGKVLVVTFWATWCHYCMHELPVLANMQRLARGRLQVVAISHDEDRQTYRYVHRKLRGLGMVLAYDGHDKAADAFGVNGIPHMVMVAPDGRIAHVHVGYDKDMLPTIASELNTLLATVKPSAASPGSTAAAQ